MFAPKCGHITGCFPYLPENEEGVKACINIDFLYMDCLCVRVVLLKEAAF